jgi:hypothetical protein
MKRGLERVKLKNLHCKKPLSGNAGEDIRL